MERLLVTCLIGSLIGLTACQSPEDSLPNLPDDVKLALVSAGPNASELTKAIAHYSNSPVDSLQLRAAYFLIANMTQWHYYEGKILDDYTDYLINIRTHNSITQRVSETVLDSLFGHLSYDKLEIRYDVREITEKELIGNIDKAFREWHDQPWGKSYSFSQFCRYILPFKMGDGKPEYNREEICDRYKDLLTSGATRRLDAITACSLVNTKLKRKGWDILLGTAVLPHLPSSKLLDYQVGSCREQTDLGAYIMRSLGIPVALDFIPQWPTRSMGHEFAAIIDSSGKPIMFGAADENPGFCRFTQVPKGKVFRHTIEKNMSSLAMTKDDQEFIPEFLRDSCIQDVTDEYATCTHITVPLGKTGSSGQYKHAYLCLFNNEGWVPVDWGVITNDSVQFSKVETNILCIAGWYDFGAVIPATYPFIVSSNGKIHFLVPDTLHWIKSDSFRQVFPALPHYLIQIQGKFEASDDADFQQKVLLHDLQLDQGLQQAWNTIKTTSTNRFRYIRYFTRGQCVIGDLEFYSADKILTGKIITSGPDMGEQDHFVKEKAFDSDVGTSYISLGGDPAWIGLDLGEEYKIDSIRFSPGISVFGPRCYIVAGDIYELSYWDHNRWVTFGRCTAGNNKVYFQNLPTNTLFKLHDLSRKLRERCFTLSNGKQTWW